MEMFFLQDDDFLFDEHESVLKEQKKQSLNNMADKVLWFLGVVNRAQWIDGLETQEDKNEKIKFQTKVILNEYKSLSVKNISEQEYLQSELDEYMFGDKNFVQKMQDQLIYQFGKRCEIKIFQVWELLDERAKDKGYDCRNCFENAISENCVCEWGSYYSIRNKITNLYGTDKEHFAKEFLSNNTKIVRFDRACRVFYDCNKKQ